MPQSSPAFSAVDRLLALLLVRGLTVAQVVVQTGWPQDYVATRVKKLLVRFNSRRRLAFIVLTTVLVEHELAEWKAKAEADRQRLYNAEVVDFTSARLAMLLASNNFWSASDSVLAQEERISTETIAYSLAAWERVLGDRVAIQVTMRLAPIHPVFWARADQRR